MSANRVGLRNSLLSLSFLILLIPNDATGQALPRVVETVDNARRVMLAGNVHPLARAEFDRGAVADGLPMKRILLLLKRSDEQEGALEVYLGEQQDKSSPNYHQWVTPETFGAQYGLADSDIQAVTQWLGSAGFTIEKVYSGKTVIEFSGTAGQVQTAFGSAIRNYQVNGKMYEANANDPQIPVALAPVVAGIVSLNNFPRQSHVRMAGVARKVAGKAGLEPLFTFPNPDGSGNFYGVGPGDFATIYNTVPLLNAASKIDGTGQTIAIVGETNIHVSDVQSFRQIFGLPANFSASNVVLNGEDPGITSTDEETEADLDTEWSGAVAPGATVQFVVSASTAASAGIDLSALYIIEHNLAGVMSESYGSCEPGLLSGGNAFYNSLWEQAASQGITVMISAGDNGSAGCDDFTTETTATQGLAVNGIASTPYNVAVGGTDFDQVNKWISYWSATNGATSGASALSYIPEIPWNQNCAQIGLSGCGANAPSGSLNIVAGSGGPSSVYPKPNWQMGVTGMPSDNHRELPDVSLFASPGFDGSGYIICQADANGGVPCSLTAGAIDFLIVGGTSASSPALAGIMALVNQYQAANNGTSRQGNANYVLYQLVKKSGASCASSAAEAAGCIFNHITKGNSVLPTGGIGVGTNSVPCTSGKPNCSATVASETGVLVEPSSAKTEAWTVTAGYDTVTGLGSVNANNLVTKWGSVSTVSTTTTMTLSPTTGITHGTGENVTANITVTPTSGTATGDVSLIAKFANGTTQGLDQFTLTSGKVTNAAENSLPGGSYTVIAHYAGDGTNAPSDSAPVTVSVARESSQTFIVIPTFDPSGNQTNGNATSVPYGTDYIIRMYVTNSAATPTTTGPPNGTCDLMNLRTCPTGTVTLRDNGALAGAGGGGVGIFNMNNAGYTRYLSPNLTAGTHSLVATYSGDNSYLSSTSATVSLVVVPATTTTTIDTNDNATAATVGVAFNLNMTTRSNSLGIEPTGTYTVYDGGKAIGTGTIWNGQPGSSASGAFIQGSATLNFSTTGNHILTATYNGDANYASSTSATSYTVTVDNSSVTTMTASPLSLIAGNQVTLTAIVDTTVKSPFPGQNVQFYTSVDGYLQGNTITYKSITDASGNAALQATAVFTPTASEVIWANFNGDSTFAASSSYQSPVNLTVITPDFSVSPPQLTLTIPSGQSASASIAVTPATNLSSQVQFILQQFSAYAPGMNCGMNPNPVSLSGQQVATATFSCSVPAPSSSTTTSTTFRMRWPGSEPNRNLWAVSGMALLLGIISMLFPGRLKMWRLSVPCFAVALISLLIGCGGGSSGGVGSGGGLTPTSVTMSVPSTKVPSNTNVTASVTVSGSHSPTGTITLYDDTLNLPLNAAPLVNGQAQISTNFAGVGAHSLIAQYSGDTRNSPSQTMTPLVMVVTGTQAGFWIGAETGRDLKTINVTLVVQ